MLPQAMQEEPQSVIPMLLLTRLESLLMAVQLAQRAHFAQVTTQFSHALLVSMAIEQDCQPQPVVDHAHRDISALMELQCQQRTPAAVLPFTALKVVLLQLLVLYHQSLECLLHLQVQLLLEQDAQFVLRIGCAMLDNLYQELILEITAQVGLLLCI
jgi:hypothetical protein